MSSLFDVDVPHRPEIVQGVFREGQIVTIAGAYNVGKTPLLAHIAVCVAKGIPWCGRTVHKRPVIHVDYESSLPNFIQTYRNISTANSIKYPRTPQDVDPYLLNADLTNSNTKALFDVKSLATANTFLRERLSKQPDSLVLIDPVEMFFPALNLVKPDHALAMVKFWRSLFSTFPKAAVMSSHNLRKLDVRAAQAPDLIENVHGWLREICGSNNLLNRSDVRIGMDRNGEDDVRSINGIRRGEDMHPMLLLPIEVNDDPERLGGFKAIIGTATDLRKVLGSKMLAYYTKLPDTFKFVDHANNGVPKTTLYRILKKAESMGYIINNNGLWTKTADSHALPLEPDTDFDVN